MSNKILFVFEGQRAEGQVADNLRQYFMTEDTVIYSAYCREVYQLYRQVAEDEYIDVFVLLRELEQNKKHLSKFKRDDFAQIYMFFDYDGHATNADDSIIQELLDFFDEETSFGKLYISYPMVEAIKHQSEGKDYKDLRVQAKEKISYKALVHNDCDTKWSDITRYSFEQWKELIELNLKKMCYLVKDDYVLPRIPIPQLEIFHHQFIKYIKRDALVTVLSAFPIFLFDYYGVRLFEILGWIKTKL